MAQKDKEERSKFKNWITALYWTVNILVVVIVGITVLLGIYAYINGGITISQFQKQQPQPTPPQPVVKEEQVQLPVDLPAFESVSPLEKRSINRVALLDTEIPVRSRVDVIGYTVQQGDSIFSIADDFGLKAETILWGNFDLLKDNPHLLKTGQELNIIRNKP